MATGDEKATASNVRAAFKKLMTDGRLLRVMRKGMGLGDTLGVLPPENGGTGVGDGSYVSKGLSEVLADYRRVKSGLVFDDATVHGRLGSYSRVDAVFPIGDEAVCVISTASKSNGGCDARIDVYSVEKLLGGDDIGVGGTYTITSATNSRKVLSANGGKNEDGSFSVFFQLAVNAGLSPWPITEVYSVAMKMSSSGAVSGTHEVAQAHQVVGFSAPALFPDTAELLGANGELGRVISPTRDSQGFKDSNMCFSTCAKNGASSFAKTTIAKDYDNVWRYMNNVRSCIPTQGSYLLWNESQDEYVKDRILAVDMTNASMELHALARDEFKTATYLKVFNGIGFERGEKARYVSSMGYYEPIVISEIDARGVVSEYSKNDMYVFGSRTLENVAQSPGGLICHYDHRLGNIITCGDSSSSNECIYIEKHDAAFSVDSISNEKTKRRYTLRDHTYIPLKAGSKVVLIEDNSDGSMGVDIYIEGF